MVDSDDEYERDERAADNARGRKRKSKKRSHEIPDIGDAVEEGNGGDGGRRGGGKKKKKKVKVMEESGQTDEERRALRKKQRLLQHKIVASETGAQLEDPNADAFEEIRGENNELFEAVRYTREAVVDGENLQLISERTARQVDKLVQVRIGLTAVLVRCSSFLICYNPFLDHCRAFQWLTNMMLVRSSPGRFVSAVPIGSPLRLGPFRRQAP